MIRPIRVASLVGAGLGALMMGVVMTPAAFAATPTTASVVFTQATPGHSATLKPSTVTIAAGGSVTFDNTHGTQNLSISGPLAGSAKTIVIKAKSTGSIAVAASTASSTIAYSATEQPDNPILVSATGAAAKADGQVDVVGTPLASHSAGPTPGGPSGPAAAPGSGDGPGSGGGSYVGPGLPGGVIAPLAPGATAYPNGPAPLVAPFATTAPTTPAEPTPGASSTSGSAAVAAPSTPTGRSSTRSLGLPAAVTAVVLIGVAAALVRVLLAHPAARAIPRRH